MQIFQFKTRRDVLSAHKICSYMMLAALFRRLRSRRVPESYFSAKRLLSTKHLSTRLYISFYSSWNLISCTTCSHHFDAKMTEECGRNCTLIGIVPTFGWNRRSLLLDLWRDSRCPCRCSMSEPLPWAKGYWRRRLWLVCFDPSIEYLILRLRLNKAWGRIILIRIAWRPKIHPTITCVP